MKRTIMTIFVLLIGTLPLLSQESGTVISVKANLRGTPSASGIVVTTLDRNERFRVYEVESPWYLVQSPKYVGWIHGNNIRLTEGDDYFPELEKAFPADDKRPKTTTKPLSTGETPFRSEYVGGTQTIIRAVNDTDRVLTLKFGGVTYTVSAGKELDIEAEGGRYEYYASVPRARPTSGVKEFNSGYRWTWRFYIVQR